LHGAGAVLAPADRGAPSIQVSMMPAPSATFTALKQLQPALRRIAVLSASPGYDGYIRDLRKEAQSAGIALLVQKVDGKDALPDALRRLEGKADALWVPSDPLLINEKNLVLLSQFSQSSRVPIYSPVAGLTNRGATATLSVSYKEIGRLAADTAQQVLAGHRMPSDVYATTIDLAISAETASKIGLQIPPDVHDGTLQVQP
jgi:putative tryptophan/tyrosine transport system substrate-binding protein